MKTFAAALIAAVASAVVQDVNVDVDAQLNVMYSQTTIVDMNDDLAAVIAAQMQLALDAAQPKLPDVCESGAACRARIEKDTKVLIQQEWITAYETIWKTLENTYITNRVILEEAWHAAYECEPGCFCDNIEVEYLDVIRMETEITEQIELLTTDLVYLEEKMHGVEITCPDYTIVHYDESTYTSTITGVESTTTEVGRATVGVETKDGYVVDSETTVTEWDHEMQAGDEDASSTVIHEEIISGGETEFAHDSVQVLDPTETIIHQESVHIN